MSCPVTRRSRCRLEVASAPRLGEGRSSTVGAGEPTQATRQATWPIGAPSRSPGSHRSLSCQAADRRASLRSWLLRYGRALRWPPRSAMARCNAASALATASRSGSQPRRWHSSSQSRGLRWPRCRLHRPQASTSFSSHDGPPFTLGTRWSVVGRTAPVHRRRHHTHRSPSRSTTARRRSRRSGWLVITAILA